MPSLSAIARAHVGAILAASVLAACGSRIPSGMTEACEGGQLLFAKDLRPAQPVDFVGIRAESTEPRTPAPSSGFPRPDADSGTPSPTPPRSEAAWTASFTTDVRGIPCSGATDKAACEQKIGALRVLGSTCDGLAIVPKAAPSEAPSTRALGSCSARYLVYTRGDEVGVVTDATQARAFFGDIDSAKEAFYTAQLGGEVFGCAPEAPAAFAVVPDGFEVLAGGPSRCSQRILRVSRQGVVTFVSRDDDC